MGMPYTYLGWPRGGMLMSVGSPLSISPYTFLHNSNFLHGACPIIPPWMRRPDILAITYISRNFFRDMRCFTMILFRRKFDGIWPLFVEILTVSRGFEPRAIEISHRRSHNHRKLSENLQILAF